MFHGNLVRSDENSNDPTEVYKVCDNPISVASPKVPKARAGAYLHVRFRIKLVHFWKQKYCF